MQRLAKLISNAGVCSRRDAEKLILDGQVKVDGVIVTSPATNVDIDNQIEVSGSLITSSQKSRLWIYYKPVGLITTHKDPLSRKTVFEQLTGLPRVISIGRLDLNSEGLLLLTNNGDLARQFELPSSKLKRVYNVRAYGNPDLLLKSNYKNLEIDGIFYNPQSVKLLRKNSTNSWFEVILFEGKNREIRRIFQHFGLKVNKLIRTEYGDFKLDNLKPNEYREVTKKLNKC
ncbi:pseudouridine synthase [Rickettsia sp. MEAM1 (Bemisia tabaci)]|uniref:pseudouridine synthase n=1 Tax=unclassified Rickettsia TaxID=114295 RepID=UPI0002E82C50|nr:MULTISPECIES: pseudouridine synthase [unclassified Rickettsia]ASX27866.1 pseudouridine synthase [Rickettsia sp. MEAM1 (Bemisia tabaci)]ODA36915.1 pseudouridine synthase [Rickettsia sp. wb]ODA37729.1 pseudouridine synthase [Rickettsia sp. wq]